jgi:RNA polymerase sigma-54 factor
MLHMSMQAQVTQRQSVVFTPQLQQAIKLLLLNNLELGKYADTTAEENPFLEVERPAVLRGVPSMPINSAGTNDFDPISLLEDKSGNSFRAHVFNEIDELIVIPRSLQNPKVLL